MVRCSVKPSKPASYLLSPITFLILCLSISLFSISLFSNSLSTILFCARSNQIQTSQKSTSKTRCNILHLYIKNYILKSAFYSSLLPTFRLSDPLSLCTSGLNSGNKITSLIEAESVKNIINLSIPIPSPPAGGIPYFRAST